MTTVNNLIYHSRAVAEQDWECQRSRYWQYNYEEGIRKDNLTLELFVGTVLHDALAGIAFQHTSGNVDIDKIATDSGQLVRDTLSDYYLETIYTKATEVPHNTPEWLTMMEQSTLVEGLIRGFYKLRWPALIAEYPIVIASERETIFPHDYSGKLNKKGPFVYKAKPDLVLEGEQGRIYLELKSTGTKKVEWVNSWTSAIQIHGTAKAIEFTLGEPMLGTLVQGFYKGSEQYGKFSSIFCYGYVSKGVPPFNKTTYSADYRKGFTRTAVWEMEGGVKGWVERLSVETLSDQFLQTPLIFTNEEMAESFFRQRAIREESVKNTTVLLRSSDPIKHQTLMDTTFPQSFSKCSAAWGKECQFKKLCHTIVEDPLASGFIPRDHSHNDGYYDLVTTLMEVETT